MRSTVLGARGNTKSEHRRSLPARSSQSRKGGETRYTISSGDTSRHGECRKPDTSAVGHRAPWGCFWSEAWTRVQRRRRRGLRGGSHLGERASLAEERRARRGRSPRVTAGMCGLQCASIEGLLKVGSHAWPRGGRHRYDTREGWACCSGREALKITEQRYGCDQQCGSGR